MQVSKLYNNSYTKRVLDFLFVPKTYFTFSESKIGKILSFMENQRIAETLIYLSAFLVIYQQVLPLSFKSFSPWILVCGLVLVDKKRISITKSIFWLLGFYLILSISMLLATTSGLNPNMLFLGFLVWAQFGLYIIAGKGISHIRIYKLLCLLIAPISMFGVYQYFTTNITTVLWVSEFENISFRAFSIVQDPNVFGMISSIGLLVTLILFLSKQKKYVFFAPFFATAVALSYSRTAWLAIGFSILVLVVLKYKKYLILTPISLLVLLIPKVRERILVIFNQNFLRDSSVDGRIWIFNNVLHLWKQRPLLGYGPGSYGGEIALRSASPVYFHGMQNGYVPIYFTDGQWLEAIAQVGLLGLVSLFGFIIAAFTEIYKSWKNTGTPLYLGGILILAFVLMAGFTSNIIEFGTVIIPCSLLIGGALNEA